MPNNGKTPQNILKDILEENLFLQWDMRQYLTYHSEQFTTALWSSWKV